MNASAKVCLALDVPHLDQAIGWVERTRDQVGVYKLGLELFAAHGPMGLRTLRDVGAMSIFLDLKLHDIPNTVARTVAVVANLGLADYLTIHTGGGKTMMEAAAKESDGVMLLGVTVLTSLDPQELRNVRIDDDLTATTLQRARLAQACGIQGLVCSPQEVGILRQALDPEMFLVTPGIRLGDDNQDQKRVASPKSAIRDGSNLLVLGRPVREAEDPNTVLDEILRQVRSAAAG